MEERELANVSFSHDSPMAIRITNHAVYVAERNEWRFGDAWRQRRVPIEQVRRVTIRRTRRGPMLALSLLLFATGVALGWAMFLPLVDGKRIVPDGHYVMATLGFIGAGLILPFTSRGHRSVHIEFATGKPWVWKPPLFAPAMRKEHIEWLIEQIAKGLRKQKIYVSEE